MVIHHSGKDRNTITLAETDDGKYFSDVIAFRKNGSVSLALSLSNVPFPSGAPWERYKWFPEKGNGAALFPEWIWTDPAGIDPVRCLASTQAFHLGGLAGVGGDGFFTSSVRSGGRQGHVLEELGHSIYAQCLNPSGTVDVLGVHDGVYVMAPNPATRGLGALAMPGCPGGEGMYDCRDPEHYFISLQQAYRLKPEEFRSRIRSVLTPAAVRQRYRVQYEWLRDNWFEGVEYKTGSAPPASFPIAGLQCLPGECSLSGGVFEETVPPSAPAPLDKDR
jgi:hypothetical protein